jgi:hypothetical protein
MANDTFIGFEAWVTFMANDTCLGGLGFRFCAHGHWWAVWVYDVQLTAA